MTVHIPIGEPSTNFTLSVSGHEYWVCIDERQHEGSDLTYYVYTVYRDGVCVLEETWKHTKTYLAAADAVEEIFQRWESGNPERDIRIRREEPA